MLWLLSITVIILLVVRRWKMQKYIELSKELKCGIKSYPVIGHAYLLGNGVNRMAAIQNFSREALKNGGITHIWIGSFFLACLVDAVDAEVILKKSLEKHNMMRHIAKQLIGNGIIIARVPIWRARRKISALTFGIVKVNKYVTVFAEQSESMVKQVKSAFDDGAESLWKYVTACTFFSVCETIFGVKLNVDGNTGHQLLEVFNVICKLMADRLAEPWLHLDALYKLSTYHQNVEKNKEILYRFINQIIKEKRKKFEENIKSDNSDTNGIKSFLELQMEASINNSGYSNEQLLEDSLVMLLAGIETSAIGMCFTICMLAKYPDVQENVIKELQEVFGNSERQVVVEDLPSLKYLEAVLRESLRLYPPVPIIAREINEDIKLPSGVNLKKGCGALISIWGTNRNPLYWGEDAEQFRPERFLEEHSRHPTAFLAFSHGPRNCLGYHYAICLEKTVLATFLRKFRVLPENENEVNHEPIKLTHDIMVKDVDEFRVRLVKRKDEKVF